MHSFVIRVSLDVANLHFWCRSAHGVRLKGLIVDVTLIAGAPTAMGATRKVADPARPVDQSKCDLTMPSSSILVPTRMWWYVEQSLGVVSNSMLLKNLLYIHI